MYQNLHKRTSAVRTDQGPSCGLFIDTVLRGAGCQLIEFDDTGAPAFNADTTTAISSATLGVNTRSVHERPSERPGS